MPANNSQVSRDLKMHSAAATLPWKLLACVGIPLLLLTGLGDTQDSLPPSLVRLLNSEYRINPASTPLFSECQFRGSPQPVITWEWNGASIPTSVPSEGPYFYPTNGTLVLSKATPSYSGNYTCTGTNPSGSLAVSIIIYIVEPEGTQVWAMWWMYFVYAAALWVLVTLVLLTVFLCRYRSTKECPAPVNRDEVFAIDHEAQQDRPLSSSYQSDRPGYPNPSYRLSLTTESSRQGQELDVADGLPTVGGAWPQRSVTTGGVTPRTQSTGGSGRRKSANSAFIDAKLQLVEVEDAPPEPRSSRPHLDVDIQFTDLTDSDAS